MGKKMPSTQFDDKIRIFLIAGFFFFLKAAFGAASKQSGHQEHREEYCFFPYTLQLGKEPQPIHPANNI